MNLLTDDPAIADRVADAFIARLEERMQGTTYYFDMRGRIFDIFRPPSEIPLPSISVTVLPEEAVARHSRGDEGGKYMRLPLLMEFRDAWVEGVSDHSERVLKARRARAEMKRAAVGGLMITPPGLQVYYTIASSSYLVGGADDQITAEVLVHAEYDESEIDPFQQ